MLTELDLLTAARNTNSNTGLYEGSLEFELVSVQVAVVHQLARLPPASRQEW